MEYNERGSGGQEIYMFLKDVTFKKINKNICIIKTGGGRIKTLCNFVNL